MAKSKWSHKFPILILIGFLVGFGYWFIKSGQFFSQNENETKPVMPSTTQSSVEQEEEKPGTDFEIELTNKGKEINVLAFPIWEYSKDITLVLKNEDHKNFFNNLRFQDVVWIISLKEKERIPCQVGQKYGDRLIIQCKEFTNERIKYTGVLISNDPLTEQRWKSRKPNDEEIGDIKKVIATEKILTEPSFDLIETLDGFRIALVPVEKNEPEGDDWQRYFSRLVFAKPNQSFSISGIERIDSTFVKPFIDLNNDSIPEFIGRVDQKYQEEVYIKEFYPRAKVFFRYEYDPITNTYGGPAVINDSERVKDKDGLIEEFKKNPLNSYQLLQVFKDFPDNDKEDREFLIRLGKVVYTNNVGNYLDLIPVKFREDRDFIKELISIDGRYLSKVPKRFLDDKELVLMSVKQDGHTLRHASERLKSDREVILEAVRQNGFTIEYIGSTFKNDKEIGMLAVRTFPSNVEALGEKLKNDWEFVVEANQNYMNNSKIDSRRRSRYLYEGVPKKLWTNGKFVIFFAEKFNDCKFIYKIDKKLISETAFRQNLNSINSDCSRYP